jgi:hypothetical protein
MVCHQTTPFLSQEENLFFRTAILPFIILHM